MVHKPEKNPLKCIRSGDFVRIDADKGFIEILKKKPSTNHSTNT
jgi:hypothetical protein